MKFTRNNLCKFVKHCSNFNRILDLKMSRRAEIVEYLLDQIDTALILKAETLIKLLQKYFGIIKLKGEISREICRCTKLQSKTSSLPDFIQRSILLNQLNYCIGETETRHHQYSSPHFSNAEKPSQHKSSCLTS